MTDIFSNKILCGKCNMRMMPFKINKNGFVLKAVACPKCNDRVIHPRDEIEYNDFMNLKRKEFNVKMRFVGNSYAVSIPKEIVDFMKDQENVMDNMVKLCFEELGKISLVFGSGNETPRNSTKLRFTKEEI